MRLEQKNNDLIPKKRANLFKILYERKQVFFSKTLMVAVELSYKGKFKSRKVEKFQN